MPRPQLLVIVPGTWNAVAEGVTELKRYLADEYGGTVIIRTTAAPLSSPDPADRCVGPGTWRLARRDMELVLLPQAFFSLDWMEVS
ncbi:hypothetical protein ACFSC4_31165 [Deinococcus malanensis]|uniref:hypothetical protein n=1 Tax=Deinococcus malanensis TaxID=1706855 RepID=UPI003631B556